MGTWLSALAILAFAAGSVVAAGFDDATEAALRSHKEIHVSSRRPNGEWSRSAPVWFHYDGEAVYFTTSPTSHKGRRIQRGSPVRMSLEKDSGPWFEGHTEVVSDAEVIEQMASAYREKYWIAWLGLFVPRVTRVESGKTLAVRVMPVTADAD